MMGAHMLMHWCRQQDRIALSFGEAELYSGVRGLAEAINVLEMIQEVREGRKLMIEHNIDATACKGVLLRHGAGQLKHIETKSLWVQERIQQLGVKVRKISRKRNPSDMLASASDARTMSEFLRMMGGRRC